MTKEEFTKMKQELEACVPIIHYCVWITIHFKCSLLSHTFDHFNTVIPSGRYSFEYPEFPYNQCYLSDHDQSHQENC